MELDCVGGQDKAHSQKRFPQIRSSQSCWSEKKYIKSLRKKPYKCKAEMTEGHNKEALVSFEDGMIQLSWR